MPEGHQPRYYGSEDQRYRSNALDYEHREHMDMLNHHRLLADRKTASMEREIFRSATRDLRKPQLQPEPTPPLCIELPDMDLSDDHDLDENGLF